MNRRDVLSSLTLTALAADAQQPKPQAVPSLYIPKAHVVEDLKFLQDFMDEFAFVELITASPTVRITHIPVLLDRAAGKYGTVMGHIARQNEQIKAIEGGQEAVVVFRGPHSYISPTWYEAQQAVPTWNFAVVHATGRLRPVTELKALHALVASLVRKFESYHDVVYDLGRLPENYVNSMLSGIVGFEMAVELLEGKFKLGQERSETDRQSILTNLQNSTGERTLHDLTQSFYRRKV